ncbi:MAG: histidine phosphatase family protein [Acutalibacteraceae bacterium]|nr:histidine phosphatase family protein [Acutalibacteraceae bacterium]
MSCRIYFIRHGQSLGNLNRAFLGHTNLDLSEKGYLQAEKTADFLSKCYVDKIYTSDLIRAYNTAEALAKKIDFMPRRRMSMREIYAGEWENKKFDSLAVEYKDTYGVWLNDIGFARPDCGESVVEVQSRFLRAVSMVARISEGKTIAVFTHATPIRTFFAHIRGMGQGEIKNIPWPSNASVSLAVYDKGTFREVYYGRDDFLGDLGTNMPGGV